MGNTCEGIKDYNGNTCTSFPCCNKKNSQGDCVTWYSHNTSKNNIGEVDVYTTSCNHVELPDSLGKSSGDTMSGTISASEWSQTIYYADPSKDKTCNDLSETDCKKNINCAYDPTTSQDMCKNQCCGVVNTAGQGGAEMQNNGIGQWTKMINIPLRRVDWAQSCDYLARNTLYNYDYTACYTSGKDIRLNQYFQAAQSTQNMCMTTSDVDCSSICDCETEYECNNEKCELLNVAVMGSNDPETIASMGISGVLQNLQGFTATDMAYVTALIAILAAL